ncbi:hypothetical protein ANN_17109 [Periplaneta americana]|uniref:DUF4817 domain-containing protein n=1 Tax=Periplaneta americana TaxID=6978 RepID=A0ABQ8SS07_PERAM|nr:hypothetical protein ANN_17109 [Periplaneta americana]
MDVYTLPELAYMVMCYGEAHGNGRRALHMYQQQFQNRNHPHHTMFARLYQRLRDDGSLSPWRIGGRPRGHPFSIDDYNELKGKADIVRRRSTLSGERCSSSGTPLELELSIQLARLYSCDRVQLQCLLHPESVQILPVVLYGCETWTLTLREEHRLRVFENKVLRKIFGAKRDEVTGEWRKLHNAELHALYSSSNIIRNIKSRRLRWAGHVARMGESRNAYKVLVGRPEGKRPLGRPRRRWEDNIKMDLREVGYDDRDWINLAQDRDRWRTYVRAAMNLGVP